MINAFDKFKKYSSIIVTAIAVVCLFVLAFLTVSVSVDLRDESLWAQLIMGFMLQCLMVGFWIPEGKKLGKQNAGYIANQKVVEESVKDLSKSDNYKPLNDFCKYATNENVLYYIEQQFVKLNVNYTLWKDTKEYKNNLPVKIRKKCEKIEKSAGNHVRPINANEITTCSTLKTKFDTQNYEGKEESLQVTIKVVLSLITTFIGATLVVTSSSTFVEGLAKFGYWLVVIGSSIFFAISTGYKLIAEVRNDYYLRLIDFYNRFKAWKENKNELSSN